MNQRTWLLKGNETTVETPTDVAGLFETRPVMQSELRRKSCVPAADECSLRRAKALDEQSRQTF